jgi:hypothetical protein
VESRILAFHAFHTLSFPWPVLKNAFQNRSYREGPFPEEEPLVRNADFSSKWIAARKFVR